MACPCGRRGTNTGVRSSRPSTASERDHTPEPPFARQRHRGLGHRAVSSTSTHAPRCGNPRTPGLRPPGSSRVPDHHPDLGFPGRQTPPSPLLSGARSGRLGYVLDTNPIPASPLDRRETHRARLPCGSPTGTCPPRTGVGTAHESPRTAGFLHTGDAAFGDLLQNLRTVRKDPSVPHGPVGVDGGPGTGCEAAHMHRATSRPCLSSVGGHGGTVCAPAGGARPQRSTGLPLPSGRASGDRGAGRGLICVFRIRRRLADPIRPAVPAVSAAPGAQLWRQGTVTSPMKTPASSPTSGADSGRGL